MSTVLKILKIIVLFFLCYLLQTTVSSVIAIGGVAPNLALAILASVSIALGRSYTLAIGVAVGYCMEITLPALNYLNLVLYPVAAEAGALIFADKSERKLAAMRSANASVKALRQVNPHLRTIFAAAVSSVVFEGIHFAYICLNGVPPTYTNIMKAVMCVVYTVIVASILQFPIRLFLGTYKVKKATF